MPAPLRLIVGSTWDGDELPGAEQVLFQLTFSRIGLRLEVEAPFYDDPPPPKDPGSCFGLWNFEVVELFLLGDQERYTEIELGPHGHHLVLRLEGSRQIVEQELPLDFTARIVGNRWYGTALVPAGLLPRGELRANVYAIHGLGVDRRYLAWRPVPGVEPDFHRLEFFGRLSADAPGFEPAV